MTTVDPLSISSLDSHGTAVPYGAQVLTWAPQGERPVLWMPRTTPPLDGEAIRGGIPICLPWFSRPDRSPVLSVPTTLRHGFARTSCWSAQRIDEATVRFALNHRPEAHDGVFPHAFAAELVVTSGTCLTLALTLTNSDNHAFDLEVALHTYFAVGDVKDVTLWGLEGDTWRDEGVGPSHIQHGEVLLVGPIDRVYDSRSTVTIRDPRWLREITVEKQGSDSTVVWSPWLEGCQSLADVLCDEWQDFICVESGNIRDNAMHLEAGQSHTVSVSISVDPLD
ncbi:D-hexose-6-phosphate mutarotase [Schaalia suimastitidis]|uniref:D-hexose-6-phosphate mutarotase n=1 Tax=Schaalia suimastitidis TaxID=121163 RepID=UPI00047B868B|nr:hypothetical protein [Schaalia suimastitidis]